MMWSRGGLRARVLVSGVAVGLVCLLGTTACNSGAVTPPTGGDDNTSRSASGDDDGNSDTSSTGGANDTDPTRGGQSEDSGTTGGDGPSRPKYKWQLPPGDTSPTGNEGSFYGNLRSCKGAKEDLYTENWWRGFNSPRNVLLYMAAAHLCLGDEDGGRRFYDEALSRYGTSGIGGDSRPCNVYRSVSSVLLQAAPDSFSCPGGAAPEWRQSEDGLRVDNPLTLDVDESAPSDGPSEETTDEPTDGPSDEPTDETTDGPTGPTTDDPTDETTDEPGDETTDQATGGPADGPTDGDGSA